MDGLVLSVAIGFRSYAGDGVTEWIAIGIAAGALVVMIVSLVIMFIYTRLVHRNFNRDTLNLKYVVAKQTTDQVRNLEYLLDRALYRGEGIGERANEIQQIKEYFESISNDEKDDDKQIREHFNRWKELYHGVLDVLLELSITHHLIREGAISMRLLNSCSGGRILREYDELLEPLLRVWKLIEELRPEKKIYYRYTWDGITELVDDLRALRLKAF